MKAFLTAMIAAVLIAIAANFILHEAGFSSQRTVSSDAVRLD